MGIKWPRIIVRHKLADCMAAALLLLLEVCSMFLQCRVLHVLKGTVCRRYLVSKFPKLLITSVNLIQKYCKPESASAFSEGSTTEHSGAPVQSVNRHTRPTLAQGRSPASSTHSRAAARPSVGTEGNPGGSISLQTAGTGPAANSAVLSTSLVQPAISRVSDITTSCTRTVPTYQVCLSFVKSLTDLGHLRYDLMCKHIEETCNTVQAPSHCVLQDSMIS